MGERFVLAVPGVVTARFLVATDARAVPGVDHLREAVGDRGLGRVAAGLLGAGRLTAEPVTEVTSELRERLHRLGGPPGRLRAVFGAARHITVTAATAPGVRPRGAQAARLTARVLAAAVRGTVADLDSGRILPPEDGRPAEPERFVLGRDWAPVYITLEPDDATRARAETAGLHRFGLPEVAVRRVPYGSMLTAANLVRGLAWQLFAEQAAWLGRGAVAGPRETPAERPVTEGDVMNFWGDRGSAAPAGAARVRLGRTGTGCPGCPAAIEAHPASEDRDAWWSGSAARAMPKLVRPAPAG